MAGSIVVSPIKLDAVVVAKLIYCLLFFLLGECSICESGCVCDLACRLTRCSYRLDCSCYRLRLKMLFIVCARSCSRAGGVVIAPFLFHFTVGVADGSDILCFILF